MKTYLKMLTTFLIFLFILGFSVAPIWSETPPEGLLNTENTRFSASINWETKELSIIISAPVDHGDGIRNRATLLSRKENELREFFPTIFPLCLHALRVDSLHRFQDLMATDPQFSLRVQELAALVQVKKSQPASDLKSVAIEYSLPFKPAIYSLFISQLIPQELPRLLAWQPAADYTGLIIHVADQLDWYGTDTKTTLLPSLFPRLFDEDARLLLDRSSLDPIAARTRGMISYTATNPNNRYPLAGTHPLVVSARAVFGETPTDLMISREEANILLYNEKTRSALRQGNVVVVMDSKMLQQELIH